MIRAKPFPINLKKIISKYKSILTIDEQTSQGSLGSLIMENSFSKNYIKTMSLPDYFIFENIGDWLVYDIDQLATYGSNAMDFPSETYSGAGFIYNHAIATVSDENTNSQEPEWWDTYEGNQGLYFVSGVPSGSTTLNNDWMISPEFSLVNVESPTLRFMAKT